MLESVKQLLTDHGSGGLFSALAVFPKATKFETQDEEEKIILLLRPHFVTNIWWIILSLLMSVVPQFLTYIPVISLFQDRMRKSSTGWPVPAIIIRQIRR